MYFKHPQSSVSLPPALVSIFVVYLPGALPLRGARKVRSPVEDQPVAWVDADLGKGDS